MVSIHGEILVYLFLLVIIFFTFNVLIWWYPKSKSILFDGEKVPSGVGTSFIYVTLSIILVARVIVTWGDDLQGFQGFVTQLFVFLILLPTVLKHIAYQDSKPARDDLMIVFIHLWEVSTMAIFFIASFGVGIAIDRDAMALSPLFYAWYFCILCVITIIFAQNTFSRDEIRGLSAASGTQLLLLTATLGASGFLLTVHPIVPIICQTIIVGQVFITFLYLNIPAVSEAISKVEKSSQIQHTFAVVILPSALVVPWWVLKEYFTDSIIFLIFLLTIIRMIMIFSFTRTDSHAQKYLGLELLGCIVLTSSFFITSPEFIYYPSLLLLMYGIGYLMSQNKINFNDEDIEPEIHRDKLLPTQETQFMIVIFYITILLLTIIFRYKEVRETEIVPTYLDGLMLTAFAGFSLSTLSNLTRPMIRDTWKPLVPPHSDSFTKLDEDDHDESEEDKIGHEEGIKEDDETVSSKPAEETAVDTPAPQGPVVSVVRKPRKRQGLRGSSSMEETPPRGSTGEKSSSILPEEMFKPIRIAEDTYSKESRSEMDKIKKKFLIESYTLRKELTEEFHLGKIVGLLSPKTEIIDFDEKNVNYTEDACYWKLFDDRLILAIADGVGSRNYPGNGSLWSKLMVRLLVEESIDWENLDTHLAKQAKKGKEIWQPFWDTMSKEIEEREKRDGKTHSNCCTLSAVDINFDEKTINWFVLGDSPIFKLDKKDYSIFPEDYLHRGPTECISSITGVMGAPKVGSITDYDDKNESILLMTDGLADWVMVNPATQTDQKIRQLTMQRLDDLLTLDGKGFTDMHMKCHDSEMKSEDHYTDEDTSHDDDWTVLHFSSKS